MRKGQAATEFLTTYGFALLLIGIGVGAAFFLTQGRVSVPTQCSFIDPFVCNDLKVSAGANQIELDITGTGIETSPEPTVLIEINGVPSSCNGWDTFPTDTITCTITGLDADSFYSGTVSINYKLDGGSLDHSSVFTISGTVEA